jgi:hypothetical protein
MRSTLKNFLRVVLSVLVGAATGLLLAIGLLILCVVVCYGIRGEGQSYDEGWAYIGLTLMSFWICVFAGPIIGGVVGGLWATRRCKCPEVKAVTPTETKSAPTEAAGGPVSPPESPPPPAKP